MNDQVNEVWCVICGSTSHITRWHREYLAPIPGEIVHVGPTCTPAICLDMRDTMGYKQVYVRVLRAKFLVTPGIEWGEVMPVETNDMEGWIDDKFSVLKWHWPER